MNSLRDQIQLRLGEHFVIERELGGGGMSRVFVAQDRRLDRRVVVKLLRPELSAGVSVERFRREIRLAASLQHALIVPVLDVGDLDGLPYFLMPFIDGESLRARLVRGPLNVVDTVRILRDVARALAVAHAKGVVHRDIKPDNVLLSGDAAVVADFGVAKAFASARHDDGSTPAGGHNITTAGTSLGTPAYMAPEQVAADPNGGAAIDLYAFGIMAYEMLTGAPPFTGRAPHAVMAAHITETPTSLVLIRPELPSALVAMVMRCLEKDPAQRPDSAAALVEQLEDPTILSGSFTPIPDDVAAAISSDRMVTSADFVANIHSSARANVSSSAYNAAPIDAITRRGSKRVWYAAGLAAAAISLALFWLVRESANKESTNTSANVSASTALSLASVDTTPSVAVLPFVYLGGDTAQTYLARAITDAVTNGLSGVSGLRVASRSSSEALQRRIVSGDTARLPVRTMVEGVVEQEGSTVRLTVRLVNASDGFTLFADQLEGDRERLFDLEDEIADAMRERLASYFGLRIPIDSAPR